MSTRKQSKTKKAGSSRKAPKSAAPARAEKTAKTRERDPRLPAVGTTIVRPYKGKDIRVKVLADGFEYDGAHYRSLTRCAMVATGYAAISGPAFFRLTGPAPATPKSAKTKEKPAASKDVATETAPAAESATA